MSEEHDDQVRSQMRAAYAEILESSTSSCSGGACGPKDSASTLMGYGNEELGSVPDGANLNLGCGNPQAFAALQPGEIVLDLGSGAGLDAFLAANLVGRAGRVIGVDMTPEMVAKARGNARLVAASNVEFRLGEIEHLPLQDASVDVVISNCVINLCLDKSAVFREALRVLKPGGRVAISDVVAIAPIPVELAQHMQTMPCCIAGATTANELRTLLLQAGFERVEIEPLSQSRSVIARCMPGAEDYVASATIVAAKPDPLAA